MAVIDKDTGELSRCRLRGAPSAVLEFLAGFEGGGIAGYEAGPAGVTLARRARGRGVDMRGCAPGLIPATRPAGARPTKATPRTHRAQRGCRGRRTTREAKPAASKGRDRPMGTQANGRRRARF